MIQFDPEQKHFRTILRNYRTLQLEIVDQGVTRLKPIAKWGSLLASDEYINYIYVLQRKKPLKSYYYPKATSSDFQLHSPKFKGLGKSSKAPQATNNQDNKQEISLLLWNVNKAMAASKKACFKKKVIKEMNTVITCLLEPQS